MFKDFPVVLILSVKDPESSIYEDFKVVAHEQVPFSIKRTVINLHHLTDRCKEEMELLEIARLINYHTERKDAFPAFIEKHKADPTLHLRGLCFLMQKCAHEENKLYTIRGILGDYDPQILASLPQQE